MQWGSDFSSSVLLRVAINQCFRAAGSTPQASDSSGEDDRRQQQDHQNHFADQCLHVLLLVEQTLCTPDTGIGAPHSGGNHPRMGTRPG